MVNALYILLFIFYCAVFVFIISKWKFFEIDGTKRNEFVAFFILKVAAGIAITLVYTCYYTEPSKADIYRYFNDSKIISSVLFASPVAWLKIMLGINIYQTETFSHISNTLYFSHPASDLVTSNSFFIRVISLLNYLSGYNIFIDTLLLNFITFMGLTALYKALSGYFKGSEKILFIPVFLLPSVIFWSSGLLKESLILPAIGVFIFAWLRMIASRQRKWLILSLAAITAVGLIKVHVAVFIALCCPLLRTDASDLKFYKTIAVYFVFYASLILVLWYFEGSSICERIIDKRNEFVQLAVVQNAGTLLNNSINTPGCGEVGALLPAAIINAIFRPFLWERGNILQKAFAVENLIFLLAIFLLPVCFFKKPDKPKLWLALFCFALALLNYTLIGLTVPVMGAIVHYRIVGMPFLLLGVLALVDLGKWAR